MTHEDPSLSRRDFLRSSSGAVAGLGMIAGLDSGGAAHAEGGGDPAEPRFTLATMPRIDVHAHIRADWSAIDNYMTLREALKKQLGVEMAMWISLGSSAQASPEPPDMAELRKRYGGRIQFCIFDYTIKDGLRYSPQDLLKWQERGVAGFKFYPGWQPGVEIDHPANDPVFAAMDQIRMVAASPHVANPCGTYGRRTEWFAEPVEFWRQQHAWENVLKKYPQLVVVNAHMLWLCYSDEQLDYLRYMLKSYPNLHIDLATTAVFLHAVGRDNLREFIIEHADRVLFGTDIGSSWFVPELDKRLPNVAEKVPQ
ncbi:MAG: amidohydrolase family protein, partial [Pirellulales bacterium]|nr:amidohydrolase family protein [Pirellulales bacterium]